MRGADSHLCSWQRVVETFGASRFKQLKCLIGEGFCIHSEMLYLWWGFLWTFKSCQEQSQPSRKEDSPSKIHLEVTTQNVVKSSPAQNPTKTSPVANDQRRTSSKASSVSSGSKSPCQTDTPKRGGRRSSSLPSKRMSTDRSQHEILQMIYSKRRSGASEANLIGLCRINKDVLRLIFSVMLVLKSFNTFFLLTVAKSWADVVKLGAKQTQTKVVKRGPQRQLNKRQKRINTPKVWVPIGIALDT